MKLTIAIFLLSALSFSASADQSGFSSSVKREAYTGKALAKPSSDVPEELQNVGITEKIGDTLDLNLMVTNEKGEKVPLSSFFRPKKPVVISPIYFNCPGLCNFHLNGFTETLSTIDWSPSKEFDVIAFSFDSRETPEIAAKKKENYIKLYGREGTDNGWHFVTADEETVKKVTDALGFQYKWNEAAGEWSHASAAIILSPEGKISRYLHGIQFEARDVKLALNEASNGKVGNIVDSVMLYCFKYDSHQSKYGLQVFNLMKLAGAVTVAVMALWLAIAMIQAKRENT